MSGQKPLSILLVDDEADACEVIGSMLSVAYPQITVFTATDGRTGLDIFRMHKPEIVISDINMPELDGIQLMQRISEFKLNAHIIVITAHSDRHNLDKIVSTGISSDYVPKPIDFEVLFAAINRSIAACVS